MAGRILPDLRLVQPPPAAPRRAGREQQFAVADVVALFDGGKTREEIAAKLGCSMATVAKKLKEAGRRRREKRAHRTRFAPKPVEDRPATMPAVGHPALSEARTLYPSTVVPAAGVAHLLVSGQNAWKIGDRVEKGRWKGFPIYTLTLEERATCPTSCRHWRSCFGNHMQFAKRIVHDAAFEDRLGHELAVLQYRHPTGFAVRLHVLGDFYSVGYVALWRGFLDRFPALHAFGFTARIDGGDPIARALVDLVSARWDRFALRFSNAPVDECATVSIEHPVQKPADAVICPQQTGRTANCGTCGFCWQSRRRVAFLRH